MEKQRDFEVLETARLLLRVPQERDALALNAAVTSSFEELSRWLPWAKNPQTIEETAAFCRRADFSFSTREELTYLLWEKNASTREGEIIGVCGFHNIDWQLPRLEIGYWLRSDFCGRGLMSEAVNFLTEHAFANLGAARLELRCDARNTKSAALALRCGFSHEGTFRNNARDNSGELCDTQVFARLAPTSL